MCNLSVCKHTHAALCFAFYLKAGLSSLQEIENSFFGSHYAPVQTRRPAIIAKRAESPGFVFSINTEDILPPGPFWGWRELNYFSEEKVDRAGFSGTCRQKAAIYNSVCLTDASLAFLSHPPLGGGALSPEQSAHPTSFPHKLNPHSGPALVG